MDDRFADTSGWAAYIDAREQYHSAAVAAFDAVWQANHRVVTTNWVFAELTALLNSPLHVPRPRQVQVLDDLRIDPGIIVVEIDRSIESEAWQLWRTRLDKYWSLVDCASFVVMSRLNLIEAITADHHFEQAGFVRLLK